MVAVKTILFVEDDPVTLTMYRDRLEREGFHIETAQDGPTALKSLLELTVDLVILDLGLPTLDGANVLKCMHMSPGLKDVPVIVFSNTPLTQLSEETMSKRTVRRLVKTESTFPMVLQAIHELLSLAAARKSEKGTMSERALPHVEPKTAQSPADSAVSDTASISRGQQRCEDFLKDAFSKVPKIREHCCAYIRAPGSRATLQHLLGLQHRANSIGASAASFGCTRISMLTDALNALVSEIMVTPSVVTPSILQTIAQSVDCLGLLLKSDEAMLTKPMPPAKVLAVDDDAVCNFAIVNSLKRAKFEPKSLSDPLEALQALKTNRYDVVLLDINMPGLTGFEVCEKMRQFPHCKTTPVIFITGHSNFDNRKQSVLSGGDDFITKPIYPLELALKTTVHLLKEQVRRAEKSGAAIETGSDKALEEALDAEASDRTHKAPDSAAAQPPAYNLISPVTQSCTEAGMLNPVAPEITDPKAQPPIAVAENNRISPVAGKEGNIEVKAAMPAGVLPSNAKTIAETKTVAPLPVTPQISARPESVPAHSDGKSEMEWRDKLRTAETSVAQSETRLKENQAKCSRLEQEIVDLRKEGSDLQSKLASDQVTVVELRRDVEKLRSELKDNAGELQRAKADVEQKSEERTRLEQELQRKIQAAETTAGQTQKALAEAELRGRQREGEIVELGKVRSELQNKLTAEQHIVAALRSKFEAFQQESRIRTEALEREKADLQRRCIEQALGETELRLKLQRAETVAGEAQNALAKKEIQWSRLNDDTTVLEKERLELQGRLGAEQRTTARLHQEFEGLRGQLYQNNAELEQARTELERQSIKLNSTTAEAEQARLALQEKEKQCGQLDAELAGIRQVRDDLQTKFAADQQAFSDFHKDFEHLQGQLDEKSVELERVRTERSEESERWTQLECELREQLKAGETAAEQLRTTLAELECRSGRLAEEVSGLQKELSGLRENLAVEQNAAVQSRNDAEELRRQLSDSTARLEKSQSELQERAAERARLESELQEHLKTGDAAAEQTRAALAESDTRNRQLAGEITALQGELSELRGKLAAEQTAVSQSRNDVEELRRQLSDSTARLEKSQSELQERAAERARLESELQEHLKTGDAAAEQTRVALAESETRNRQLAGEISALQSELSELRGKLAAEQTAVTQSRNDVEEIKRQLQNSVASLETSRKELQEQAADRARWESEMREQLSAAKAAAGQAQQNLNEKEGRHAELEQSLVEHQNARNDLQNRLAAEQQSAEKLRRESEELSERLHESTEGLESARAELKHQWAEAGRVEAELRTQLEGEIFTLKESRDDLQSKLAGGQEIVAGMRQQFEALERQVCDSTAELERSRAELRQQSVERMHQESDLRNQLQSAREAVTQAERTMEERTAHHGELERELEAERQLRDELHSRFAAEQQAVTRLRQMLENLEPSAELERIRSEMQKEAAAKMEFEAECRALEAANETLRQELRSLRGADAQPAVSAEPVRPVENTAVERGEIFRLAAPAAKEVLLAGDFTGWNKRAIPMRNDGAGIWTATVTLEAGRYHYMFVVDGHWQEDPKCTFRVPNSFGGRNMVREVL